MAGKLKYGNHPVDFDGQHFDSKKEATYYVYFRDLARKGEISNLRRQVPFELLPDIYEQKIIHLKTKDKVIQKVVQSAVYYYADFVFTDKQGKEVVVDVKSEATRKDKVYVLKKKMMKAILGIDIREI